MNAVVKFPERRVEDDAPLPVGEYSVAYTGHDLSFMFNSGKLFVRFKVVAGEYTGRRLYRAYRVKMTGKRTFTTAPSSELYRQFCRLSGRRERRDRLDVKRLKNAVIRANVRTVTHDSKQRALPEYLQYSVIGELLELEAGRL